MDLPVYQTEDWRLVIDSSKRSCVLLHNGNKLASIPIAYLTKFKEKYRNIKLILENISLIESVRWLH